MLWVWISSVPNLLVNCPFSGGSWLAFCMQGHTANSVLGCKLPFGALRSVEVSSRAAGGEGSVAHPMPVCTLATPVAFMSLSVRWYAFQPVLWGQCTVSKRLQLLLVLKYFWDIFGTEPTSSLSLSWVQSTTTHGCFLWQEGALQWVLAVCGLGEGQQQALFRQAGWLPLG